MKLLILLVSFVGISSAVWADCGEWQEIKSNDCNYQELGGKGTAYHRTCNSASSENSLPVCHMIHNHHPYPLPLCSTTDVCLQHGQTPDDLGFRGCGAWSVQSSNDSFACKGQSLNLYTRWNTCTTLGDGYPERFCAKSTPDNVISVADYTKDSFDPENDGWVNCHIKHQANECQNGETP